MTILEKEGLSRLLVLVSASQHIGHIHSDHCVDIVGAHGRRLH